MLLLILSQQFPPAGLKAGSQGAHPLVDNVSAHVSEIPAAAAVASAVASAVGAHGEGEIAVFKLCHLMYHGRKFHYVAKKIIPPRKSPLYSFLFPASLHYTAGFFIPPVINIPPSLSRQRNCPTQIVEPTRITEIAARRTQCFKFPLSEAG